MKRFFCLFAGLLFVTFLIAEDWVLTEPVKKDSWGNELWFTGPASDNSNLIFESEKFVKTDVGVPVLDSNDDDLIMFLWGDSYIGEDLNNNHPVFNNNNNTIFLKLEDEGSGQSFNVGKITYKTFFDGQNEKNIPHNTHELPTSSGLNQIITKYLKQIDGVGYLWSGVYPSDYFYVCPSTSKDSTPDCSDSEKKLMIVTSSELWIIDENDEENPNDGNIFKSKINNSVSYAKDFYNSKMLIQGTGFYDYSNSAIPNCRINPSNKFSDNACFLNFVDECKDTQRIFPPLLNNGSVTADKYDSNPLNIFPYGSKFNYLTVLHNFEDIYKGVSLIVKDGALGIGVDSKKYIYFLGSGEISGIYYDSSIIQTSSQTLLQYLPVFTGNIYMARVEAVEHKLYCASNFEYFTGIKNGVSEWTNDYNSARPLTTFDKKLFTRIDGAVKYDGRYWITGSYLSSDVLNYNPRLNFVTNNETSSSNWSSGLIISSSPDGFQWGNIKLAPAYKSNYFGFTYAHFIMPEFVIDQTAEAEKYKIPFIFSHDLTGAGDYNVRMHKYNYKDELPLNDLSYEQYLDSGLFHSTLFTMFPNNGIMYPYSKGFTYYPEKLNSTDNYVLPQYCVCGPTETLESCRKNTCPVDQAFNNPAKWKPVTMNENATFKNGAPKCSPSQLKAGDPDISTLTALFGTDKFLCSRNFNKEGVSHIPVWNWSKELGEEANIILRYSYIDRLKIKEIVENPQNNQSKQIDLVQEVLVSNNKVNRQITNQSDINNYRTTGLLNLKKETWYSFFARFMKYIPPINTAVNFKELTFIRENTMPALMPELPLKEAYSFVISPDIFTGETYLRNALIPATEADRPALGASIVSGNFSGSSAFFFWGGSGGTSNRLYSAIESSVISPRSVIRDQYLTIYGTQIENLEGENHPLSLQGIPMFYNEETQKLFLVGAPDNAQKIPRIYELNLNSRPLGWRIIATLNKSLINSSVSQLSETIYAIAGGSNLSGALNNEIYYFDTNAPTTLTFMTNIPGAARKNAAMSYDEKEGKLFVYGGKGSVGLLNDLNIYDIETNTWSSVNSQNIPEPRELSTIIFNRYNNTLLVTGGADLDDAKSFFVLDMETYNWEKVFVEENYCIKREEEFVYGGLSFNGSCEVFAEPDFENIDVNSGAEVFSIAGKDSFLFAGTQNGIYIADILDDFAIKGFVPLFFTPTDIKVVEDRLIVVSGKHINLFSISNLPEITLLNTVSKSEVFDYISEIVVDAAASTIFSAESDGIYAQTLSISSIENRRKIIDADSVVSVTIKNTNLYISQYPGVISVFDLTDINYPEFIDSMYLYCPDQKIIKNNGNLYASCGSDIIQIEMNGNILDPEILSGDVSDISEPYIYNGIAYFPETNGVRVAK